MASPAPAGSRARPRRLARVALACALLAGGLVALELAVRVRQRLRYGHDSDFHVTVRDPATGLAVPPPGKRGPIEINSLGFRGPEIAVRKPAGVLRLAFIGASATFCAEASSNAATWPERVWAALCARHPEQRFEYFNAGIGGYTLALTRQNLEQRVLALEPDIVLIYDGSNDIAVEGRAQAEEQGLFRGDPYEKSWLGELSVAWHLLEKNWRYRQQLERAASADFKLRYDLPRALAGFTSRLDALLDSACTHAPLVVEATLAHRYGPGQDARSFEEASRSAHSYMPYLADADLLATSRAYNESIRARVAAHGALLVEAEDALPRDAQHFVDAVHFTDAGCARMAELWVEALEQSAAFAQLLARASESRPAAAH